MKDPSPEKLVDVCARLHRQGFLAAADGNVSYRDGEQVLMTPSGVAKAALGASDLARLTLSGAVLAGSPSSEKLMHLAVYRHCDRAAAVVHAHPPHAIALSIARPAMAWLPDGALSELVLSVGAVPVVPYARPSTAEMGERLTPFLPERRALILARHGVLCWGESLEEAYQGVERLEHACKVLCLTIQMGGYSELSDDEVAALRLMRRELGERIR